MRQILTSRFKFLYGRSWRPRQPATILQIQNGTSRAPSPTKCDKEIIYMKATGIVRRIDDLGRVVIPKEIRRTMKIREGDPLLTTLTPFDKFCFAIHSVVERAKARH